MKLKILADILDERDSQDRKWGDVLDPKNNDARRAFLENEPRQPAQTSAEVLEYVDAVQAAERQAKAWQGRNDRNARSGHGCSWEGILLEEVYEAFAETEPAARRKEFVQVAAVAAKIVECLDLQSPEPAPAPAITFEPDVASELKAIRAIVGPLLRSRPDWDSPTEVLRALAWELHRRTHEHQAQAVNHPAEP